MYNVYIITHQNKILFEYAILFNIITGYAHTLQCAYTIYILCIYIKGDG